MASKKATTVPSETKQKRSVEDYSEVLRQERPSSSCWSSYIPMPTRMMVDIQQEEEEILLLLRQHPITQLKYVGIVIVLALLPIVFGTANLFDFLPATYRFAGTAGWYLLTAGFALESLLKWFFRVFIITDERIIDVDFISLIMKDVSTTKIDRVEDITAVTGGFLASLVRYGTVIVQTAATKQELMFENVPNPSRVTALLNELLIEEELEKFEGRVR